MSKKEATAILNNKFEEKADKFQLTIKHDDKSWTFDKDDFTVNTDIHTILSSSEKRADYMEDPDARTTLISQFEKFGSSVNVAFNYMFVGLDEKIEEIIKEVEVEPENSIITFDPSSPKLFDITNSKSGLRVDKAKLYKDINDQFIASNSVSVDLEFIEELATITKEYNETLTQKVASFSTNVADSTGGRNRPSVVSDAFEAIIAAIYIDGGMEAVRPYILRFIKDAVKRETSFKDNKSLLQEEIQKVKGNTLAYEEVGEEGPDHDKTFVFRVKLNGEIIGEGKGKSKKEAEQNAAGNALCKLHDETL
jgi:hypothetical protein